MTVGNVICLSRGIPEITLTVHPVVAAVVKKCTEEGTKPKVADFDERVKDPTFLNALQSGVNRWIREIQKVLFCHQVFTLLLPFCSASYNGS